MQSAHLCQICANKFEKKGEPECHHMIPFVLHGPDDSLNYAFLCGECHGIFTHDEYSEIAKESVAKNEDYTDARPDDYNAAPAGSKKINKRKIK